MKESLHVPALICNHIWTRFNTFFFIESEICLYTAPKLAATNLSEFEDFSLKRKKKVAGNTEV